MTLYGLILGLSIVTGFGLIEKTALKYLSPTQINHLSLVTLVAGILGARLYHVIDSWFLYQADPLSAFFIWQGGLSIIGGILGGLVGSYLYFRLSQQAELLLIWLDIVALNLPLSQAIGRWGNYINQELYGLPTNLPWGILIKPENRLVGFEQFSHFQPLFAYESLLMLILFLKIK